MTIPTNEHCPWPRAQVRVMVANAIAAAGGKAVWDFVPQSMQDTIVRAAIWDAFNTAVSCGGGVAVVDREVARAVNAEFRAAAEWLNRPKTKSR